MPLRFQHTNQPTSPLPKLTQQQGAKSTTSMNMNVRQMSLSQHISSMIVPVFLSSLQCPGQQKLVYAMLDSQSDSSFIIDQTLDNFSVPTEETVINLSTMNETLPIVFRKVDGFKVQGYEWAKNISLPMLYSRPEFPNDNSHIPSANNCNKLEHLKPIANNFLPLQNVEIGRFFIRYQLCPPVPRDNVFTNWLWPLRSSNLPLLVRDRFYRAHLFY